MYRGMLDMLRFSNLQLFGPQYLYMGIDLAVT